MKKLFKCLSMLLCLCLLLCACTTPTEQPNDTNAIFPGDYTYEKQPIVMPIASRRMRFTIDDFAVLKAFYAIAGQGEDAFVALEKDTTMCSPIEHIDLHYDRRDYFLMLFDFVRDQKILVPKNENLQITLNRVWATPPDFDFLSIVYNLNGVYNKGEERFTALYSPNRSIPSTLKNAVEPITVNGEGYRIDFYDEGEEYYNLYPSIDPSYMFKGYLYCDDATEPIMYIELRYDNPFEAARIKEALPVFSECQLMTIYEAMVAAPTPEGE